MSKAKELKAKELAEAHWSFIAGILERTGVEACDLELNKYLYIQAYIHGAKHEREWDHDAPPQHGEFNEARAGVIGQNGNDGEHYG